MYLQIRLSRGKKVKAAKSLQFTSWMEELLQPEGPFLTILGSNPLPLVTLGLSVQPFLQRRKQENKCIEKR